MQVLPSLGVIKTEMHKLVVIKYAGTAGKAFRKAVVVDAVSA